MRKFVTVTLKRGKASKPKDPSKTLKQQKTPAPVAAPHSDYDYDDGGLNDHNEREFRSCSPDDDIEPSPPQPDGDDFNTPAYRKWLAYAFAGLFEIRQKRR